MDSPHSEVQLRKAFDIIARFQESARCGHWTSAGRIMAELKREAVPADPNELAEYLRRLQHALGIARASRSTAIATLHRIQAVAKFNRARGESSRERQNFVDMTTY
jgi:hypothetical protein